MEIKDEDIILWAKKWFKNHKYKKTRKNVAEDVNWKYLVKKFRQAHNKFPDLCVNNHTALNYATVDRIDNTKDYQKGNIQIIPSWLNHAKHTHSEDEIENILIDYVNNILLEIKIDDK